MALVHCRECGEKISDQAPSCPKCGAPQQQAPQKTNGNNSGFLIGLILIVVLGFGGYFYLTTTSTIQPPATETRQDRIDAADRLLARNCTVLANMSNEYIKNDIVNALVGGLATNKCDCIREKLREKLADKYTLIQILEFEKKPLHEKEEIKNLIEQNNEELKDCFKFINKMKDKIKK